MCEYPEFINITEPKARRSHRCQECGGLIQSGEQYTRIAGKWAGDFSVTLQCMICAALWNWLNSEVECLSFGMLWEGIIENDMEHHVPREMLPHNFLMWIHRREIEEAENQGEEGVEILPQPNRMLGGLMGVHAENSNPRLWKRAQKSLFERAARAGASLHYLRKEAAKEGRYAEYCREQLAKPAI